MDKRGSRHGFPNTSENMNFGSAFSAMLSKGQAEVEGKYVHRMRQRPANFGHSTTPEESATIVTSLTSGTGND
jgi:hypothetical protein